MKKAIAAFILILLLAAIGTPGLSCILMERALKQTFVQLNQMYAETGKGLSYEIIDYDRGFFSLKSDLVLPVELVGENPKLLQPVFPGMKTGLFVRKGEDMIHHAETRTGKLFCNGHEVRLR